jgi:hypothetical protein
MPKAAPHSTLKAILIGGSLAAALDILDPILFYGARGISALRVLQSIAAGLLGRAAYTGGLRTALIGLALHLLIALLWAAAFVLASHSVPFLTRRAIASGLLYGAFIYVVMNFLVLPHSHAATRGHATGIFLLNGIAAILLLVGLPISLVNQAFTPRTVRPRVSSKTHA